jgi:hypothetical protein
MNGLPETVVPCPIDLFGNTSYQRAHAAGHRRQPLELKVAGALCRQLRRKSARHEKQRIAHLICLNLVALLKARTQP